MRVSALVVTAVLFPAICAAQTSPTNSTSSMDGAAAQLPALDPATNAALVRAGGQLMMAGKAYDYDRVLADDIGPRLTGSANYVKAVDWAVAEFEQMGLSNVRRDPWEINATWEPEVWATANIVKPHEQRLHLEADGWSPSTPSGGVHGSVFYLSAFTPDTIQANAGKIKGALIFVDNDSFKAGGQLPIGKLLDMVQQIADEGAHGLMLGIGATNNVPSMAGLTCCNGTVAPLPVANVGKEDTLLLRRLLDRGPVEVEFSFTNRVQKHVTVNNVVAEIPGTDNSGEFVVVAGHLDSWQLGTGAEDNGTGAASVLAVAQAIKAAGIQPRRTMRFILFGGEEEDLLGSISYVREHAAEMDKCVGVFVTDTGSEAPKGWYVWGRDDEKQALAPIKPLLDALGAGDTTDDGRFTFDTDHAPFLIHGVPVFVLWTPTEKYFLLHHKPSDTFDKVNQRDLNLGAAVVGVTALAFADVSSKLPHYTADQLEDQLKKIKSWDDYQDMLAHHDF
jgi:carboxypeptidase Q